MNYSNGLLHLQGKLLKTTLVWMKCPTQVCELEHVSVWVAWSLFLYINACPIPEYQSYWTAGLEKQMILLAMIISQSTNPSSSSAYSTHPVDTCSWCTMPQHWGFICSCWFLQRRQVSTRAECPWGYGDFIRYGSEANLFQSPPRVTLPCKAGNAETKASSVGSISKKTELTLPGKQNLSFLLNSLSAYLLDLSKLGWNIIKGGGAAVLLLKALRAHISQVKIIQKE